MQGKGLVLVNLFGTGILMSSSLQAHFEQDPLSYSFTYPIHTFMNHWQYDIHCIIPLLNELRAQWVGKDNNTVQRA